jgi:hypothetical protein
MPTKSPKPKSAEAPLSLGSDADDAVKRMFSLSPAESRRIIAETSPKPKAKRTK